LRRGRPAGRDGDAIGSERDLYVRVIAGALSGFTRPRYLVGYHAAAISPWSSFTVTTT
jgi:hypothetical protein